VKALLVFGLLASCGDDVPTGRHVDLGDPSQAGLVPDGATGNGIRPRRRMDIDQLTASIQRVTNGIGWFRGWDGRDEFDVYAQTLGKPNYTDMTAEDLTPSLLFEKFLDDASRNVCDQLVDRERAGAADPILLAHVSATDTLATNADGIRQNLAALLLRFHGRVVDPASPQIDPWVRVFDASATATADPLGGWRAVCVGLFLHPDFYSF
jgi:hypothetical protein